MADKLGKKAKKGATWATLGRIVGTGVQFVGGIFLARLLEPADFGTMGIAAALMGFGSRFGTMGFGAAVIQRKSLEKRHVDSFFVLSLLFRVVVYAVLYLTAPYAAQFFGMPRLAQVLPILSLYFVIGLFANVPLTLLKRRLDFKQFAVLSVSETTLKVSSSVGFAFGGFGIWSLVYGQLIGISFMAVFAMVMTGWRPAFQYDKQAAGELFSFSKWVLARDMVRHFARHGEFFVIGRLLGDASLGQFERAFNLMRLPHARMSRNVNTVLFSAFSRIQDEGERIRCAFRKVILSISIVAYPTLVGLMLVAPDMILVAYGEKWRPAIIPLQIMCLSGILRSLDPFLGSVLTATGHVRATTMQRTLQSILLIGGAIIGTHWGIVGVAGATVIADMIVILLLVIVAKRVGVLGFADFFAPQLPALGVSLFMAAAVVGVQLGVSLLTEERSIVLIVSVIVGGLAYLAGLSRLRSEEVIKLRKELQDDLGSIYRRIAGRFGRRRKPALET